MSTLIEIFLAGAGVILMGLIGYMAVRMIRRKMIEGTDEPTGLGFSMLDFKKMYERGELTQEEYLRAKAKYAARMKGTMLAADPSKDAKPHRSILDDSEQNPHES